MSTLIGVDFETYGAIDLPKHGLHRYVNNPTFMPLLAATAWWDGNGFAPICKSYDLVEDYEYQRNRLFMAIGDATIVAHNAGFEQAVLRWMGLDLPSSRFVDSAVLARAAGAGGKLEVAAPQLLGTDKADVGAELIKLFSIPGKYQEANGSVRFDPQIRLDKATEWADFDMYCRLDAKLSLELALLLLPGTSAEELVNSSVTLDMNNVGWRVDLAAVEEMERRYLRNIEETVENFREWTGAHELNLNSQPQLTTWCIARGVRSSSFDEAHVEKLIKSVGKKLANPALSVDKVTGYAEVLRLLQTKQVLGGSSLKKLKVILNSTSDDGRLRDQYLHIGAGASFRTTGRGVQMQNLKRLHGGGDDMAELFDQSIEWDNQKLASNLRQVFTASDPNGRLIVGDFSSVESRGLAWQAGEQWKLDAYHQGQDLYKVQAGLIFGKAADQVTKDERQIGKVGELACGYGAGPDAVKAFAEKMGVDLSEGESIKLVKDWRGANPWVVKYWYALDAALHMAIETGSPTNVNLPKGRVNIVPFKAPYSLRKQVGDAHLLSLKVRLSLLGAVEILERTIHGTRVLGKNIQYWKPSERKTGNLWTDRFTNPKTKQLQKFTLYGGKLSGLLTQSLCREVFFASLREVHEWCDQHPNVQLVGQFHDEIVLDWVPGQPSLEHTQWVLAQAMTNTILPGFPLSAEIKHDYRYTK